MKFVKEKDSMGTVLVPENAYYGPQTQRAIENFPVSGLTLPPSFIHSLSLLKKYAALVNRDLGLLNRQISKAIVKAADEVKNGKFDDQFIIDVFQTGSGTSFNMNMNEVISSRANEIITGRKGGKIPVHPNDHVNLCQSSNDAIPSAIHISAAVLIKERLIPSLDTLLKALRGKEKEFSKIKKIGRTHLQDALQITLGQEFSGYAGQVELGISGIKSVRKNLYELALGGTAVGTGINAHPQFAKKVIAMIAENTGIPFKEAGNHFAAQSAQTASMETSGALKTIAAGLIKTANDIRWLSSGPRCGIGEINIPPLQPGSSMMPGKVNPVIPEAVMQAAAQVMGNDTTIMLGAQSGNFELNTMLPVIAYNLLQSISLISGAAKIFAEKCISGISANAAKCASNIDKSLALSTLLVPYTGYDRAAEIAKKAYETGKTIREIASEEKILSEEILNRLIK
ncbi:MAG: fumarate hydratase, class [Thermodesulfobacteriota bacterium]|nr:fumarate hydratase, class [Thermodesulfobacteriota bacterium]